MKSVHFFSFDHNCKKNHCIQEENSVKEAQFSKIPCCEVETLVIDNQDFTLKFSELKSIQKIILAAFYIAFNNTNTVEKNQPTEYLNPKQKRYGYHYRIAMQSFLC